MSDILEMSDDDFMRQGETLLSTSAPEEEQLDDVVQEDNDLPDTLKDGVDEQVEEESISRTILDMAKEQATWLRKENAILDFYNGLGRK